jgi:hypothetical protein
LKNCSRWFFQAILKQRGIQVQIKVCGYSGGLWMDIWRFDFVFGDFFLFFFFFLFLFFETGLLDGGRATFCALGGQQG